MRNAVIQFALVGMLALAALSVVAALLLRKAYRSAETSDAKRVAATTVRRVVEAHLTDGLIGNDPAARSQFDQVVHTLVLSDEVRGLTLIHPDGRVLYSDIPSVIGSPIDVPPSYVKLLAGGGAVITARADNGADDRGRSPGLIEAVQRVSTPSGQRLLLESYISLAAVNASAGNIWVSSAPAFLGALIVLELVQLPLAVSLARGVRDAKQKEETLLRKAIESSAAERRRIAADLHDGVVQDLAAANFGLTAAVADLGSTNAVAVEVLSRAASSTRKAIAALRTLLVEIYPPNIEQVGLGSALQDLFGRLQTLGIDGSLSVPGELRLPAPAEAIVFRTAQEALRNVTSHAHARHVTLTVTRQGNTVVLEVTDDGLGFVLPPEGPAAVNGHLGLRLLGDLATDAGAVLTVDSRPGAGTRVRLEVPV